MTISPVEILLVEDDPGDIELIQETIKSAKIKIKLQIVNNGADAISYLKKEDSYSDKNEPGLVILDLNLPLKSGMDVLDEIKSNEELKHIPIIVMSTSDQESDVIKSYKLGANSYVTKPMGIDEFSHIVSTIEDFWLSIVKLPKRTA